MGSSSVFGMNTSAFYIIFSILICLWVISIIFRRYQTYYASRPQVVLTLHPLARAQAAIPQNAVIPTNQELPLGLETPVIESFPKFSYCRSDQNPNMKVNMTGECSVCLGAFEEKEMLRLLPKCGHVFHADCVDTWLRSRATCPFCRANLLLDHPPRDAPALAEVPVNIN